LITILAAKNRALARIPMTVLIDASPLLLRSAGVKNYLYHWIAALRRQARGERIRLFPFIGSVGPLDHDRSVLSSWETWPRLALLYFVNRAPAPVIDSIAAGADLFHATNQVRRPPRRTRLTATVHDLTCWLMPELHTPANVRADQTFAERVLRRAVRLIAVSECTKRDAVRILGLDPERIEVIYPGVAEAFFRCGEGEIGRVRERYRLARPYALSVGTLEPRKNLDRLLEAWGGLARSLSGEVDLVVAGPRGWAAPPALERLQAAGSSVRYLGYVPESDLPGLTAGAAIFVYPSLYEGFGFPVAQALACGVPAVVSNVSSLPEVAGDAALLVDPRSTDEIRQAIERLLLTPALAKELAAKARRQAQRFRWETAAQQSLAFFRRAAS
jgi:glycosyltransferase involved in cell wall biosynthesis